MRSVSSAFQTAIAAGGVRLCEIYEVELANGTIYRYTDHDKNITWDAAGNTYTAIPLHRGPIRFNTDGQSDECDLEIGIRDLAVLNTVKTNILEAAKITHKRIRWDTTYAVNEEITLGIWVPDVGFDASNLSLKLRSLLDTLNIELPGHQYQEPCNNFLFDPTCGLVRSSYAYAGAATAGTRTTLTDANAGTVFKANFTGGDSSNPLVRGDTIHGANNDYTAVIVQVIYLTATTGTIWFVELSNSNNFESAEEIGTY